MGLATGGELADHFPLHKATLSAHFAVLKEADLIAADKHGTSITYRLRLSVLEDALLAFADSLGLGFAPVSPVETPTEEGS